jgi:metal-sulfur cluster biosynthetic enzyme
MDPSEQLEIETRIGDVLKSIFDPEIPVNIYDLGLIYDVALYDTDST